MKKMLSYTSMLVLAAGFCCAAPAMALSQTQVNEVVTATTLPMKMSASVEHMASSVQAKSQSGKLSYGNAATDNVASDSTPAMRATASQDSTLANMSAKTEPGIVTLLLVGIGLLALRVTKQSSQTFRD